MKLLLGFLKLIRWPNLAFIALAQCLFYYCIEYKIYTAVSTHPILNDVYLVLLCFSSICIAAAGYIINDYFDVNIDIINKPHKLIIGKIIKPRWAMVWHWMLSIAGIVIGIYIDYKTIVEKATLLISDDKVVDVGAAVIIPKEALVRHFL